MITNLIYILIMSSFLYDSFLKLSQLPNECDLLRSKYDHLQDFFKRHTSHQLPYDTADIVMYAPYIIGTFASLQALLAMFVVLGQRQLAIFLILMTLLQTFVMHNPYFRNSTDIDRQRCFKHIYTDLCLIATLFMITDY